MPYNKHTHTHIHARNFMQLIQHIAFPVLHFILIFSISHWVCARGAQVFFRRVGFVSSNSYRMVNFLSLWKPSNSILLMIIIVAVDEMVVLCHSVTLLIERERERERKKKKTQMWKKARKMAS